MREVVSFGDDLGADQIRVVRLPPPPPQRRSLSNLQLPRGKRFSSTRFPRVVSIVRRGNSGSAQDADKARNRLLLRDDIDGCWQMLLDERKRATLPPFSHLALLRASATSEKSLYDFFGACGQTASDIGFFPGAILARQNRRTLSRSVINRRHQPRRLTQVHNPLAPPPPQNQSPMANGHRPNYGLTIRRR